MDLSIVVPVYGAPELIDELYTRIKATVESLNLEWELILVFDMSPDNSWSIISEIAQRDTRVVGIKLSRNFGQHEAIHAGLSYAKGERIIVMDCDLQDRPEEIPKLYKESLMGFDIVIGQRIDRKDGFIKRLFSALFFRILNYLTEIKFDNTTANFGCYSKKVIKAILEMKDYKKSFTIFRAWIGFSTKKIEIIHDKRGSGKSSYTFKKAFNLAVNIILSFSDKPLRIVMGMGFFIASISFCTGIWYFILAVLKKFTIQGWASLIISIWFLSGVLLFVTGFAGLYIARIFDQVKSRPVFIIDEIINYEEL